MKSSNVEQNVEMFSTQLCTYIAYTMNRITIRNKPIEWMTVRSLFCSH